MERAGGPVRGAVLTPPDTPPGRRPSILLRLLDRLHGLAASGWGRSAAAAWAFLQGSVVPGPLGAVLVPLGLADPSRVFSLARWSAAGATLGGGVAYALGAFAFEGVGEALRVVGIDPAAVAGMRGLFAEHGGWVIAAAGIVPFLPAKVVAIGAGFAGYPFLPFIAILAVARSARFAIVAVVVRYGGEHLLSQLKRRTGTSVAAPPARSEAG